MEMSGQLHSVYALLLKKEPVSDLGGSQNGLEQWGKGLLPLLGIESWFHDHLINNLVTVPSELSWLLAFKERWNYTGLLKVHI
jgi:hypothetical protein